MQEQAKCPVCGTEGAMLYARVGLSQNILCRRCGPYNLGSVNRSLLGELTPRKRASVSGWIREHPNCSVDQGLLDQVSGFPIPSVGERAARVLFCLSRHFAVPGEVFQAWSGDLIPALMGEGFCQQPEELRYLLSDYLTLEKRFLVAARAGDISGTEFKIAPQGWAFLDSLSRGNPASQQGFIAMWFGDAVRDAWHAIEEGIRLAGYRPLRIDQKPHNSEITDEIIAEVRKSKFLVADLTGHRNGVYYEAGFAKGLGLDVIWLCREDHHKDAHFDVRQYNCIFWEDSDLAALTMALKDRIEATLGRGPITITDSV